MLVEIGRSGEASKRLPLSAHGGKQQHFTIPTFKVGGGEDGGDTFAGYRFREDEIPVVKVQPDIFLEET